MHAFDVLGDPTRRRIIELLSDGERTAGDVVSIVGKEFGISQPAVSRQLRILREAGFASATADGTRRIYALEPSGLDAAQAVLDGYRTMWRQRLDALHTEIARGRSERRRSAR